MIPQREINAWREQAPWSNDVQVEQDLLITRCMVAVFEDEFLRNNLAMRGGTALHKVHLAPAARYSKDIDLVLLSRLRPAALKRHLTGVLQPIMRTKPRRIDDVLVAARNFGKRFTTPSEIIRQNYPY